MRRLGKIVVCLASGLVLNTGAPAQGINVNAQGNPYEAIVARNVFGLNPVVAAPTTADDSQLPKITPNGTMSILGRVQVLFKVAGTAKPGQPAKEESYILSEGQRQDEIEVIHIDEKAGLVTFNNHGTMQEIPLANAPTVSTTPASVEPGGRGHFGRPPGGPGATRAIPTRAGYPDQQPHPQFTMTPEVQTIMIAAQHAKAQQAGDPTAAIFPPTEIDAEAGVASPTSQQ